MSLLNKFAAFLFLFAISNAYADEIKKDLYLSAGYGESNLSYSNDFFPFFPEDTNSSKTGNSLGIGYIFNKYIAMELEHAKLGTYKTTATINGNPYEEKVDISLRQILLVANKDIRKRIAVNAYLGYGQTIEKYSKVGQTSLEPINAGSSAYVYVFDGNQSRSIYNYGLGITGKITNDFFIRYTWLNFVHMKNDYRDRQLFEGLSTNFVKLFYKF